MAKGRTRFHEERENVILDLVNQNGRVTVEELVEVLGISHSTIRLQLKDLHDKGLVLRTHGGAVKVDYPQGLIQKSYLSVLPNLEKKQAIAQKAADTVNTGDMIAIGSGSTCLLMATKLHEKGELTVVTDSIYVASELVFNRNIHVMICGGSLRQRNGACCGPTAEHFLTTLMVDKSYSGADSINPDVGITSLDLDPRSERALCACGKKSYVLADSTKFIVKPFIEKMIGFEEIDCIITDTGIDAELVKKLEAADVEVVMVQADEKMNASSANA